MTQEGAAIGCGVSVQKGNGNKEKVTFCKLDKHIQHISSINFHLSLTRQSSSLPHMLKCQIKPLNYNRKRTNHIYIFSLSFLNRFCVGDKYYLCDNKILCPYDYEERLVFAGLADNPTNLAHMKRQLNNLQVILFPCFKSNAKCHCYCSARSK